MDQQLYLIEILHQTTTFGKSLWIAEGLYLIEILHQTTTKQIMRFSASSLYLIEILHQTTTQQRLLSFCLCCILSKFYIKPQRITPDYLNYQVVSYRNSTSNHNSAATPFILPLLYLIEILHQTTTSPRKRAFPLRLYLIEILHQTTTKTDDSFFWVCCILSKFYIKPQLIPCGKCEDCCCILSKFYIKPQPALFLLGSATRCILSKFYIKPQRIGNKYNTGGSCILSKFYIKPQHLDLLVKTGAETPQKQENATL